MIYLFLNIFYVTNQILD